MRRSAFPILCLPRAPPAGQHASARNRVAFAAPHPQARPVSHIGEGEALRPDWHALRILRPRGSLDVETRRRVESIVINAYGETAPYCHTV